MKKFSLFFMILLAAWSFQSCNNESTATDSVEAAEDSNESKMSDSKMSSDSGANTMGATTVKEDDAQFAVEAASGGMMEVETSQLAQQKAQNAKVKEFAAMLVTDHTAANNELKSLASSKNITLPATMGDDHQKHVKDLNEKSGADFDKAYMKMMVDDHKEDVDKFEKASEKCEDPDLKAFAAKTLPVLRKHLDAAKSTNDALKK